MRFLLSPADGHGSAVERERDFAVPLLAAPSFVVSYAEVIFIRLPSE